MGTSGESFAPPPPDQLPEQVHEGDCHYPAVGDPSSTAVHFVSSSCFSPWLFVARIASTTTSPHPFSYYPSALFLALTSSLQWRKKVPGNVLSSLGSSRLKMMIEAAEVVTFLMIKSCLDGMSIQTIKGQRYSGLSSLSCPRMASLNAGLIRALPFTVLPWIRVLSELGKLDLEYSLITR